MTGITQDEKMRVQAMNAEAAMENVFDVTLMSRPALEDYAAQALAGERYWQARHEAQGELLTAAIAERDILTQDFEASKRAHGEDVVRLDAVFKRVARALALAISGFHTEVRRELKAALAAVEVEGSR